MCKIIILNHLHKDFPLIVAANRDEDYDRPSSAVQILTKEPHLIIGGKDTLKGGTWLAVNQHSIFAAITNQGIKDDRKRSRGLIITEILKCKTIEEMIAMIEALDISQFNDFNLVFGNQEKVFWAQAYACGSMTINELPQGISTISNDMIFNGPTDTSIYIHQTIDKHLKANPEWLNLYKSLKRILANTDYYLNIKAKKRSGKLFGQCTRSSTILAFSNDGLIRYKFFDRTAYKAKKEADENATRYNDYIELLRNPGNFVFPIITKQEEPLKSKDVVKIMKQIKSESSLPEYKFWYEFYDYKYYGGK